MNTRAAEPPVEDIGVGVSGNAPHAYIEGSTVATLRFLSRDPGQRFIAGFDAVFAAEAIEVTRTPPRAPAPTRIRTRVGPGTRYVRRRTQAAGRTSTSVAQLSLPSGRTARGFGAGSGRTPEPSRESRGRRTASRIWASAARQHRGARIERS
jgi:hypothetical protein